MPLERLVRVRPRTLVTIATLTGAFYVLLPQLANVDDSIEALGSANWGWLAGAVVMSGVTYVAAAIGMIGGVRETAARSCPPCEVALASSFVNRVTPANVGGMALNVRYMQKAGVAARRGGDRRRPQRRRRRHRPRRAAGRVLRLGRASGAGGVLHPEQQQAARRHRRRARPRRARPGDALGPQLVRAHVLPSLRQSLVEHRRRSPARRGGSPLLFGGSVGVTLAYIAALACAVAAFDGGVELRPGRRRLPRRVADRRRRADTRRPRRDGGALVAGFTGVGMDPAIAVAAVLSYRLLTFWLPILPGWLCFQLLERRNYIYGSADRRIARKLPVSSRGEHATAPDQGGVGWVLRGFRGRWWRRR